MPNESTHIAAVLLCGGESRRLGFPKEMIRVDGDPLAVKQVRKLQSVFPRVLVSSNHPEYLRHLLDVPIIEDELPDAGPLAGVLAGLRHARAERVFFLACDLPAVPEEVMRALVERAERSDASSVIAGETGFVCAVHSASIAPALEEFIKGGGRAVYEFLEKTGLERVAFPDVEEWRLRDVDEPGDLALLERVFDEVEPLPVRQVPMWRMKDGACAEGDDVIVEEWPVDVCANGAKLATVLCLPNALRELATGLASYLGLVSTPHEIRAFDVDYAARRVDVALDVAREEIEGALEVLVTSTSGASLRGALPDEGGLDEGGNFTVSASHLLDTLGRLRSMVPVFERTGGTHQVAFTDGECVRYFFEDVGRHNALDKVAGRAIMEGYGLARGALLFTGRVSTEMVVKALRQRVPVVASKAAAMSSALELAERHGLTVVGFARDGRLNVYTGAQRIVLD